MIEALNQRLEALCQELRTSRGKARTEALDHLAEVLAQLDLHGHPAPAWAREALATAVDENVEDGFDNMPV
ncbi:hypothetical protein [Sagittula salina]|uniref:Uncharacterized protein n=1 Tax=Sagittula salina TaxID=2820268 RepID=A0A940S315_9RHOB|nr:hypothetical protein [Sagittula salina]MBP0484626.1 hypothetical protein [Sagittula salina]